MIAIIGAFAVTLQALLVTWPTAQTRPGILHDQSQHHHSFSVATDAAHDHGSRDAQHHYGFCCILGSKLGTAIGPAPAFFNLGGGNAEIAIRQLPPTEFLIVIRRLERPLGARAPPLKA
jgi:hypothetical protein